MLDLVGVSREFYDDASSSTLRVSSLDEGGGAFCVIDITDGRRFAFNPDEIDQLANEMRRVIEELDAWTSAQAERQSEDDDG